MYWFINSDKTGIQNLSFPQVSVFNPPNSEQAQNRFISLNSKHEKRFVVYFHWAVLASSGSSEMHQNNNRITTNGLTKQKKTAIALYGRPLFDKEQSDTARSVYHGQSDTWRKITKLQVKLIGNYTNNSRLVLK